MFANLRRNIIKQFLVCHVALQRVVAEPKRDNTELPKYPTISPRLGSCALLLKPQ